MFKVEIKNLKIKAHIGITEMERKKSQLLLVTFCFQYTVGNKNKLDNIKYLKDYSSITKFLILFIEKSRCKSLEKLVTDCSEVMKIKFKLKKTFISIKKVSLAKRYGCESLSVSK